MPMKPVTVRRWEIVTAFVFLAVSYAVGIWIVQSTSATITDLQRTNCRQKIFLITAVNARIKASHTDRGTLRRTDLDAASGYEALIKGYSPGAIGSCHAPKQLVP